ncbi:TRAP transporter small permease subunit [Crocosphaera sp. XPORK-15E]|uniref:TRAP transporter small permease subunit n=1 Tax=Crocosphaera sp. XPORK-15E TaxID=3110247 RepID=UPI002B218F00|nr:TRAP transporter small permease subunit [Crocosphaera sp. XPORK-15E]MEA5535666.1 TRAP transporter small permease subunit [Crocosphaera sp. XPORK-15E]
MQKLLRIASIIDSINEWIGRLSYWLVLWMVLIGVWNVVGRYLGRFIGASLTSNGLIEVQWYLFDLVFLLGAAYTLKHDEHVRVDLLYKDWSVKRKALVNFIGVFIFLIPFCLMIIFYSWGTIINSWNSWEMSPDPGGLPRYPIKSMIIVSYILLIIQGIAEAIKNWAIFTEQLTPQEEHHDPSL